MTEHVLTGFGFGPIQAGLFVNEAFRSGRFKRIVIAEIDRSLVDAVRANNGSYFLNIAGNEGIEQVRIDNIELVNPSEDADRQILLDALSQSTEIVTSLPSVSFYTVGRTFSIAAMIAKGIEARKSGAAIIYTAENNNRAAEILQKDVASQAANLKAVESGRVQYLNTVIGKMSRVVTDADEISQLNLKTIAPAIKRAFLVEQFNHILVTRCTVAGFRPGIEVFIEKEDLLPFEEAKLYGHNAIHALLAYLGMARGYEKMTELKADAELMKIAGKAFINESGAALIKKYAPLNDELFTRSGYKKYAEDLLERMTNPYLEDTTKRAGRDPVRKLGYSDRIFGTMVLAIEYGIRPVNMAIAAAAGLKRLLAEPEKNKLPENLRFGDFSSLDNSRIDSLLGWLWSSQGKCKHRRELVELVHQALPKISRLEKSV